MAHTLSAKKRIRQTIARLNAALLKAVERMA